MERDLERRVIAFVAKETDVRPDRIHMETTLFGGLGVDGDDGWELVEAFGQEFGIDLAGYVDSKHFGPEGLGCAAPFLWIRPWRKRREGATHEGSVGLEAISLQDLVDAAEAGQWLK